MLSESAVIYIYYLKEVIRGRWRGVQNNVYCAITAGMKTLCQK